MPTLASDSFTKSGQLAGTLTDGSALSVFTWTYSTTIEPSNKMDCDGNFAHQTLENLTLGLTNSARPSWHWLDSWIYGNDYTVSCEIFNMPRTGICGTWMDDLGGTGNTCTGNAHAVIVRMNWPTSYVARVYEYGQQIQLVRVNAGTGETVLYSQAISWPESTQKVLALEVSGSTLKMYFDGSLLCTEVDATYATGSPGIVAYGYTNDGKGAKFDSWMVEGTVPTIHGHPHQKFSVYPPHCIKVL